MGVARLPLNYGKAPRKQKIEKKSFHEIRLKHKPNNRKSARKKSGSSKRVYSFSGGFGCWRLLTVTLSPVPFFRFFIYLASSLTISMSFLACACLRTSNFTFPRARSVIFSFVCRYFSSLSFYLLYLSHSIGRLLGLSSFPMRLTSRLGFL
jgi:hypothetical protein